MSTRFEICVATPFGPHVVDHATTQRDAEYRRSVAAEHQQARVFIREVKRTLYDSYNDTARALRDVTEELRNARALVERLERMRDGLSELAWETNEKRHEAFHAYVAACEAENLDHHSFDQWTVHGEPEGPLG